MKLSLGVALRLLVLAFFGFILWFLWGNFVYAFQSNEPLTPDVIAVLAGQVPSGSYVRLSGALDLERGLAYERYGTLYYYIPLHGTGGRLLVWTSKRYNTTDTMTFTGRLTPFQEMPFASSVAAAWQAGAGSPLPGDTYVLWNEDSPAKYAGTRLIFLVMGTFWLGTLASFFFGPWRLSRRPT